MAVKVRPFFWLLHIGGSFGDFKMGCSYGRSPPPGPSSTFRLEKPCELRVDDLTFRPLAGTKPVGTDFWQKTGGSPGRFIMAQEPSGTNPANDSLVPLSRLAGINDIDAILRAVITAARKEKHDAIERLRKRYPGRKRQEFLERLRQLRNGTRQKGTRRAVWTQQDLEILKVHYAGGRAGAYRAVRELLAQHPDWTANTIRSQAQKLGLTNSPKKYKPWSQDEQGYLLWNAGEKSVARIARKLGRSEKSIRDRLSNLGVSAKVRIPNNYNLCRVARMLGVSDYAVRCWFEGGLFGEPTSRSKRRRRSKSGPQVSLKRVVAFCMKHPDKVNAKSCDPDFLLLLEDKKVRLRDWHGSRQHAVHEGSCPRCGRTIRGNSYFRHVKRCAGNSAAVSEPEAESVAAAGDYAASGSKV
jgi:hypothetical protein